MACNVSAEVLLLLSLSFSGAKAWAATPVPINPQLRVAAAAAAAAGLHSSGASTSPNLPRSVGATVGLPGRDRGKGREEERGGEEGRGLPGDKSVMCLWKHWECWNWICSDSPLSGPGEMQRLIFGRCVHLLSWTQRQTERISLPATLSFFCVTLWPHSGVCLCWRKQKKERDEGKKRRGIGLQNALQMCAAMEPLVSARRLCWQREDRNSVLWMSLKGCV